MTRRLEVRAAGQAKAMLRTLHDHDDWNAEARGETPMQRADRAYGEILQEVRVAQTGVQILFAFLLALAFQARFPAITSFQRGVYVVTLILCAAATALLIAPAAFHRMIYRKRLKQHLVRVANRMAITGLALLLLSMVSAVLLIMDVVLGLVPALVLAAVVLTWFTMWWFVLPLRTRLREPAVDDRRPDDDAPPD
jgi:tetrahydromethanopterin S-methyltransferase subunit E